MHNNFYNYTIILLKFKQDYVYKYNMLKLCLCNWVLRMLKYFDEWVKFIYLFALFFSPKEHKLALIDRNPVFYSVNYKLSFSTSAGNSILKSGVYTKCNLPSNPWMCESKMFLLYCLLAQPYSKRQTVPIQMIQSVWECLVSYYMGIAVNTALDIA